MKFKYSQTKETTKKKNDLELTSPPPSTKMEFYLGRESVNIVSLLRRGHRYAQSDTFSVFH